jgi:hypothetical protein
LIEIFALHGVVDDPRPDLFCHRNMVATDRLRAFLKSTPGFVPLRDALEGRGRALTIDDATVAAARAALLARDFGHAVTLFVNPWQVEDGRAYAFSLLNALLDGAKARHIGLNGQGFDLGSPGAKQAFRGAVKRVLRGHRLPEQNYEVIERIRIGLAIERIDVPAHLQCLRLDDLRMLRDAGVGIENHYWAHLDPAMHPYDQFTAEWRKAQDWLHESLGITSRFFASPFGEFLPPSEFPLVNDVACLLLHNGYPGGLLRDSIVNRINLA